MCETALEIPNFILSELTLLENYEYNGDTIRFLKVSVYLGN